MKKALLTMTIAVGLFSLSGQAYAAITNTIPLTYLPPTFTQYTGTQVLVNVNLSGLSGIDNSANYKFISAYVGRYPDISTPSTPSTMGWNSQAYLVAGYPATADGNTWSGLCGWPTCSIFTPSFYGGGLTAGTFWYWFSDDSGGSAWTQFTVTGNGQLVSDYATTAGLDFTSYTTYAPQQIGTTSTYVLSSTTGGYLDFASASSTPSCNSGNFITDSACGLAVFLFIPNANILNSYAQLPATIEQHFPFSWVASVATAVNGLTASSTNNMIDLEIDYPSMGVGTTSPLGLASIAPKIEIFGTSTIEKYIGTSNWQLFQEWIAIAIWLTFIADVFFTVRNSMHKV